METSTQNLLGMPRGALETYFSSLGEKPFRARQLMQWMYQRGVTDFTEMTDLSKSVRERLAATATIGFARVDSRHDSVDGTVKWLFASGSGQRIEAVFIPEPGRGTLCISSQVGCALDCSFCATGAQGFNRNLTATEIVGQVLMARRELGYSGGRESPVTNVVFMGMGEPLANFRAVVAAADVLMDDLGLGLSRRRVTLSTSGIVPQIYKLAACSNVALAVSLHPQPVYHLRPLLRPRALSTSARAARAHSAPRPSSRRGCRRAKPFAWGSWVWMDARAVRSGSACHSRFLV